MSAAFPLDFIVTNATAGVLGAVASAGALWSIKRAMEVLAERKYGLSGEYKSYYGDLVDGENVVQHDTVILRQHGHKISGDQYDAQSDRAWRIEGEIDKASGHIYGFYKAKSHTDAGVGVFFFEQRPGGVLDGLWAGYDSQNKKVDYGGKYTLVKNLPVSVRRAKEQDAVKILRLSCEALGEGYLSGENVQAALRAGAYVAEHDGKIVGFALAEKPEKGGFMAYLKGQAWKLPPDVAQADARGTIGCLKSVAVDQAFQKRGVGMKLVKKTLAALEKSGVDLMFSIGWKTENVHIAPVLEACGFKPCAAFEKFWSAESLEQGYTCPHCGEPPCECEAILFTKVF
ncbi:MAG: GNAT family N-acetyltransferase [Rhodospirillales bacterium]|nr:GNAT family N-acetyltransferase [Rhodospirillales bacterium]